LQRARDEAHRFAVSYQRTLRRKAGLRSSLEDIPGIGPKRRARLLRHFGSIEAIRRASVDELAAVPGMTRAVAELVKRTLNNEA
ncbi:MAG: excinuclease ABC subunit UvrC, partial [Ardenticatenia bacterium]